MPIFYKNLEDEFFKLFLDNHLSKNRITLSHEELLKYLLRYNFTDGKQIPYFINNYHVEEELEIDYPNLFLTILGCNKRFYGYLTISNIKKSIILLPLSISKFKEMELDKHIVIGTELHIPGINFPKDNDTSYPDLNATLVYTEQGWMLMNHSELVEKAKFAGRLNIHTFCNYVNYRSKKLHEKLYSIMKDFKILGD